MIDEESPVKDKFSKSFPDMTKKRTSIKVTIILPPVGWDPKSTCPNVMLAAYISVPCLSGTDSTSFEYHVMARPMNYRYGCAHTDVDFAASDRNNGPSNNVKQSSLALSPNEAECVAATVDS
ncbi:uncharacterized protein PHALS_00759 [Plasmopara halstedii]|uniref:Uncharacterized protein n=1 Tax=Plasmopara halstedii TaxID=4781 RepID=A0A0P1ASD4_PLAHL|nr:uncharacterized protein PHALS_00759 [Plasmopara halstedii]CEG44391.1 hypothetical protein PHALS_00759 [Plasmopara halstedii]|eukprot:XP_024580760.1 hypothetical protein PHALS_00759 [Plasmopara halstedii]